RRGGVVQMGGGGTTRTGVPAREGGRRPYPPVTSLSSGAAERPKNPTTMVMQAAPGRQATPSQSNGRIGRSPRFVARGDDGQRGPRAGSRSYRKGDRGEQESHRSSPALN